MSRVQKLLPPQQDKVPPEGVNTGVDLGMQKLLAAQQQQLDDITSESSFLEFLRNEQSCLAAVISSGSNCVGIGKNGNGENSDEVDVNIIFDQVNQLAGSAGNDEREVDEILREAEQLIRKQPVLVGSIGENWCQFPDEANGLGEMRRVTRDMRDISCESTPMEMRNGVLEELEAIARREEESKHLTEMLLFDGDDDLPVKDLSRRKSFVISTDNFKNSHQDQHHQQRPHITPNETFVVQGTVLNDMRTKKNVGSSVTAIGGGRTTPGTLSGQGSKASTPKKRIGSRPSSAAASSSHQFPRKSVKDNKENQLCSQSRIRDLEEIYNLTLNDSPRTRTPCPPSPPCATTTRDRTFCDKSTAPSPTHATPEPIVGAFSWSKERELEGSISELQEKLKDTEERYESLKIQYDNLSQVHRTLRENHGSIQEESDKLKLEVQHLTECANVLRSELHSARGDRDAALELQKILQSELEESRRDKKRYQELNEKDTKTIQDLQRQCREMERILMRKHPDSVSALIVASKNTANNKPAEDASQTRKLLEQRIAQLEADAKEQDAKAQGILANVQARFNSVQSKYETHIADLEMQVLSLQEINCKLNEKIVRQMDELSSITSHAAVSIPAPIKATKTSTSFSQTEDFPERECTKTRSISVQTDSRLTGTGLVRGQQSGKRASSASAGNKLPNSLSDSQIQGREDAHLMATIRGMRVDLAIKEKAVQRLTREVEDCKKTIKKLQKERDTYLKPDGKLHNSSSSGKGKFYDPLQYSDSSDGSALKDAQLKIRLLEADYKTLHDKRLQDLKTLQAAHERELAACHESVRILQQRLSEREEHAQTKEKRRPNHNNDYYALKAKLESGYRLTC
ncbi:uncharacterized protein LOC129738755 isoform X2 [Uranotaenia lowii]|uniref:uncharacterized protein LOC129738755 isoform X2 n=1 Tax=Uranotaenia lowii TaxID=190385 RepID=UPI002478FBFD|nr:uncharacterized protein LOC129738755 isoform X2 [Uranotaenia lowii]